MSRKLSQLDAASSVNGVDLMEISQYISEGLYTSKQIPASLFINQFNKISSLEMELALTQMRLAEYAGLGVEGLVGGFSDSYMDETGINGSSTYIKSAGEITNCDKTTRLLHFNGHNGSTVITDSVNSANNGTCYGNATISTAHSVFGGASAVFDRVGDYIRIPFGSDLFYGVSDWTVELRFWSNTANANQGLLASASDFGPFGIMRMSSNKLGYYASSTGSSWNIFSGDSGGNLGLGTIPISTNTWYHIAVCRKNGVIRAFVNGVLDREMMVSVDTILYNKNEVYQIGTWGNNTDSYRLNGYIDELRIVSGEAMYWSSGFTPPQSEYIYAGAIIDMILVSAAQTAVAVPTTATLNLLVNQVDALTVNTDLMGYVSRDGGTTWTQVMLTLQSAVSSVITFYSGSCSISGQPSGTSMCYKIVTANSKQVAVLTTSMLWG